MIHIVSWHETLIGDLLKLRAPRALCGYVLNESASPDPFGDGEPFCVRCLERDQPLITRALADVGVRGWLDRVINTIADRLGVEPRRPDGTTADLTAYAVAYAERHRLQVVFQRALDDEADRLGLVGGARTAFYLAHTEESEMASAIAEGAADEAAQNISQRQQRLVFTNYPMIKHRKRPR